MEEIIKEINMLYYEINNIYLEMYKLELNDKKDDTLFLELIGLLKEKIEEEKKICQKLIDKYMIECEKLRKKNENNNSPLVKRFMDYLRYYMDTNVVIYEDDDEDEVREKIQNINYAKLYGICSMNIFLIYLSFLQEYVNNLDIEIIREKLLNIKYCNSFINHDMELSLIENKFDVSKINYVNLYFVADTLKLDNDVCDEIILDCYYDTIFITIKNLLSICDVDYNNNIDIKTISINNQCMLRAGLSMLSESNYRELEDKIYNLIYLLKNDSNGISYDIILSILSERKRDKSRVRKISIRPRED